MFLYDDHIYIHFIYTISNSNFLLHKFVFIIIDFREKSLNTENK